MYICIYWFEIIKITEREDPQRDPYFSRTQLDIDTRLIASGYFPDHPDLFMGVPKGYSVELGKRKITHNRSLDGVYQSLLDYHEENRVDTNRDIETMREGLQTIFRKFRKGGTQDISEYRSRQVSRLYVSLLGSSKRKLRD